MNRDRSGRYEGFRRMQSEMDRMLLDLMGPERYGRAPASFRPNMDLYFSKIENAVIVKLELAGVDRESVHLEAKENLLVIRGHRVDERPQDRVYQQMEIAYGPFERRVQLPVDIDTSKATAHYDRGFLEIVLPLTARGETRRIAIHVLDEEGDDEAPGPGGEEPGTTGDMPETPESGGGHTVA